MNKSRIWLSLFATVSIEKSKYIIRLKYLPEDGEEPVVEKQSLPSDRRKKRSPKPDELHFYVSLSPVIRGRGSNSGLEMEWVTSNF